MKAPFGLGTFALWSVSFETVKFACMNEYTVHSQTLTASIIAYALFPNCEVSILFCAAGVETTRRFLLEWLSYTCRYIPVGLLDVVPQRLNWRPPSYYGRDELETLMASDSAADWVCSSLSFQIINSKSFSLGKLSSWGGIFYYVLLQTVEHIFFIFFL